MFKAKPFHLAQAAVCAPNAACLASPRLEVFQGHCGVLVPFEPFVDDNDALTGQERVELADHMLTLWQAFKDLSSGPDGPDDRIINSPGSEDEF